MDEVATQEHQPSLAFIACGPCKDGRGCHTRTSAFPCIHCMRFLQGWTRLPHKNISLPLHSLHAVLARMDEVATQEHQPSLAFIACGSCKDGRGCHTRTSAFSCIHCMRSLQGWTRLPHKNISIPLHSLHAVLARMGEVATQEHQPSLAFIACGPCKDGRGCHACMRI